jgi:mediator of RNA polymerase II transcription subunit 13
MTLSSPVLRQILSASKKVLSNFTENQNQIVFEFVPEQFISNSMEKSSPYDSALDLLSSSVYNRISVFVDRTMAPHMHGHGESTKSFMSPTFTLSRSSPNKVSYVRAAHTSLDVMDRYTLLHVAYHLTACGKWILASCIDQRGEAYDLGVWLTQSPGASDGEPEVSDEEFAVRKVWDFAMQFAKKANVEWRVVFARLGVMNEQEMNGKPKIYPLPMLFSHDISFAAWTSHLAVHVLTSREQPPLHHSVVCVEPDAPWLFVPSSKSNIVPPLRSNPPTRSSPSSPKNSTFTDVSATTYALFPSNHMAISLPPSHTDFGLSQSFIPEPASTSLPSSPVPQPAINSTTNTVVQTMSTTPPPIIISDNYSSDTCFQSYPITLMPLSTTTLIHVPASSSLASIRMTHIHLLCTFHSHSYTHSSQVSSCPVPDNQQLHKDITKNYHELAVLAKLRWKLAGNPVLPFHLAAVDNMRMSLDRDRDRLEVGGDS